jgi:hypothetical protein
VEELEEKWGETGKNGGDKGRSGERKGEDEESEVDEDEIEGKRCRKQRRGDGGRRGGDGRKTRRRERQEGEGQRWRRRVGEDVSLLFLFYVEHFCLKKSPSFWKVTENMNMRKRISNNKWWSPVHFPREN